MEDRTNKLLSALTLENEALRQQLASFLPPLSTEEGRRAGGGGGRGTTQDGTLDKQETAASSLVPGKDGGSGGGSATSHKESLETAVSSLPPGKVGGGGSSPPPLYLVLNAIGKDKNIGSLLRTAVAFGVKEVCVCGANAKSVTTFGAKGTERYGVIRDFPGRGGLEACSRWLREQGVALIGLEITREALPISSQPFSGPTAIMPGNETTGLTDAQKALCSGFTYIPQFGNGTASLNVAAATAIALHSFATWAGYEERPREVGVDKFFVDTADKRLKGEVGEEHRASIQAERVRVRGVDGLGDFPPAEF